MNNRFSDINDLNELRANLIGRLEAALGYECVASDTPQETSHNILEEYYNRKEEITQ